MNCLSGSGQGQVFLQCDEQLYCVLVPTDNRLNLGGQRVEVEEVIEGAVHLIGEGEPLVVPECHLGALFSNRQ